MRFLVRQEYLEEIEGDLEEVYADFLNEHSSAKAKRLYNKEVFKLVRPALLRKFSGSHRLNQYGMFKNYFKTSLRSLKKNTLFSAINITGLAISMSVGILMIVFLSEVSSVDDFHKQKDRIYKVTSTEVRGSAGQTVSSSSASYYIGEELRNKVPGVEEVVILRDSKASFDMSYDNKAIPVSGYYTQASFFEVFSFNLINGSPMTALTKPNSVVLTETAARRIFGDIDPMGKIVSTQQSGYLQNGAAASSDFSEGIVTGIVQDPPANSHLQFEMLLSISTLNRQVNTDNDFRTNPDNTSHLVYLLLDEHADADNIASMTMNLMAEYNSTREDNPMVHDLQPMDDFFTSDTYHTVGPNFPRERIRLMIGLTLIVLLSACFNYTNLSLARALRRSKEVGIRKVAGATRYQVFSQFTVEAVMLSFFAMASGLILFYILKPEFLKLAPPSLRGYDVFSLEVQGWHLVYFFLFALAVGLVAGLLPSLFHSKLNALSAFQNGNKPKVFSGISLRKILIICQFALSIGLIMTAVLVNKQYQYTLNYDLGYETENILTVDIQGDYIETLENEYRKLPGVVETSKSSWVLGVGGDGLSAGMIQPEDRKSRTISLINEVDINYMAMHKLELLAGTSFFSPLPQKETAKYVIVNESLLGQLTLGTPEEAIGKSLWYNGRQKVTIKGVIADPVSIGLTKKFIESFVFIKTNQPDRYKSLNLKVQSTNLSALLSRMEVLYLKQDPVHPFNAKFYDDKIEASYQSDKNTFTIISFLALLSVSISTLGLLGMAVFTTETRLKEISIRKVLGANIGDLMVLLSRNFLFLIIIAGLIAIPATWYIVDTQVLNNFWQRANSGLLEALSGLLSILAISILTVGWQIRQAATKNPADLLRND